jgi:hypothetical protein
MSRHREVFGAAVCVVWVAAPEPEAVDRRRPLLVLRLDVLVARDRCVERLSLPTEARVWLDDLPNIV